MKIRNLLMLTLAGVLGTACTAAEDEAATEEAAVEAPVVSEDQAAVEAIAANYQEHLNMGHADVVAGMYHDDAITVFADGAVQMGRAEIEAGLERMADVFSNTRINREATHMGDGFAVGRGTWSADIANADGEPMANGGRYMTVFRQGEDGAWKIHAVISNYDSEQPPEAYPGTVSPNADNEEDEGSAALVAAYEAAWNAGDVDGLAALWAEDAYAAFSMIPTMEGRDAIAAGLAELIGGTMDIHSKSTIPLGDGWSVNGGWFAVTDIEEPFGGTYMGLVWTGEDGTSVFQWGVSNSTQHAVPAQLQLAGE